MTQKNLPSEEKQTDLIMTFLSSAAALAYIFGWDRDIFVETAERCFSATTKMIRSRDHAEKAMQ